MFKKILIPILIFIASIITTNFILPISNFVINIFLAGIITYGLTKTEKSNNFNYTITNIITSSVGVMLILFSLLTQDQLYSILRFNLIDICQLVITIFVLFFLFMALVKSKTANEKQQHIVFKKVWFVYAILYAIVALLYFLAYYPGALTVDSINQWSQAHSTYPWNNWHPIGHTFLIWLTSRIWNSPASFVLLQSVMYTYTFSYLAATLREKSEKNYVAVIFFVITAILPYYPLQSVIVLKDTLFTYAIVLFGIYLFRIVETKGKWLNKWYNFLFFFFVVAGVLFWRNNGLPIIAIMSVLSVFIFNIRVYWRLHVSLFLALLCYFFVQGPVSQHFHVFQTSETESYGMLIQVDAGIIHDHGKMTQSQKEYFNSFMPEQTVSNYTPGNIDAIKFGPGFNSQILSNSIEQFKTDSMNLIKSNPKLAASAYADQTKIIWRQNAKLRPGTMFRDKYGDRIKSAYFLPSATIKKYGIKYNDFNYSDYWNGSMTIKKQLKNIQNYFERSPLKFWLMPAIYTIVTFIVGFKLLLKWYWKGVFVTLPLIGLTLTLFLAIPAPDIRYVQVSLIYVFISYLAIKNLLPVKETEKLQLT